MIGDIEVHANDYILLVGPQGNKKTTPCDKAKDLFKEVCPDLLIGSSTQSAEDIVKIMSDEKSIRTFTNEKGNPEMVVSFNLFINEFKNFIAYAPLRMINFLGDIYDRKFFDSSTIKRGGEIIINPAVNLLGCENPDQLAKFMKNDIMTGGFSRRIVIVYEMDYEAPKAIPVIPASAYAALARVKQRLIDSRKLSGRYEFSLSGKKMFVDWYNAKHKTLSTITNPLMKGYTSTEETHLLKICMALDSVSDKPMLLFTPELLEIGISLLTSIRRNMPKIAQSAGRNELYTSQLKVLEVVERAGGMIPEKMLKVAIQSEMNPQEIYFVFKQMTEETDQLIKRKMKMKKQNSEEYDVERVWVFLPNKYQQGVKEGWLKE